MFKCASRSCRRGGESQRKIESNASTGYDTAKPRGDSSEVVASTKGICAKVQPHGSAVRVISAGGLCHEEVSFVASYSFSNSFNSEWEKDIGRDMSGYLLPGLQKLRQICNYAAEDLSSQFEEREISEVEKVTESDQDFYSEELSKKRRGDSPPCSSRKSKKTKSGSLVSVGDSTKLQV